MTTRPRRPLHGAAARNAAKTRCDPAGHDLTNDRNVYRHTDRHGHQHRWCRPCAAARAAAKRATAITTRRKQ
jgi:hypothetical protein